MNSEDSTANTPGSPVVLVVDDDRGIRKLLGSMLSGLGYAAYFANDGAEGLELLKQHTPRLVLLDLQMPRMSGATFRAVQRNLPGGLADIPVVIVSGLEDGAAEARRLRAADYIGKPISAAELQRILAAYCGAPAPNGHSAIES
jgi:CheY-like chemotaxis protein